MGVDSEFARLQVELTESASLLADLLACSTDPFLCLKVSVKTDSLFSKCSEFIIAESTISYACRHVGCRNKHQGTECLIGN